MPIGEAEQLFEMALSIPRYDAMLNNRDTRIDSLISYSDFMNERYNKLLSDDSEKIQILIEKLDISEKTKQTFKDQLRISQKKTVWGNIKFYIALAALGVMTYIAVTD